MELQTTRRISTSKKILGITFIAVPLVLFALLIISPHVIAKAVFGVFGFATFIIFGVMLLVGIALLRNARYTYPIKYVVYLSLVVFSVLSIFHLIFANKYFDLSFGEYTKALFNHFSAGGIVFGSICYLLTHLIYRAGAYVFYIILGTIFTALLIDIKHAEKQFKRLSSRSRQSYINYEAKQRGVIDNEEHVKIGSKKKVVDGSPVLVNLTNKNFRRPVQSMESENPKIIAREQQKSAVTTSAEEALRELGLKGENSGKMQSELVKKQLQDYILTPSSIQVEPVIKNNDRDRENGTVINDNNLNDSQKTYQNTINPVKRVYNNVPTMDNIEPPPPARVTPVRSNRFNRETPPTVEPIIEKPREPVRATINENVLTSESVTPVGVNRIESEQRGDRHSIKAEVDDIEARINSILDAEKDNTEETINNLSGNEDISSIKNSADETKTEEANVNDNKNEILNNDTVSDSAFIDNKESTNDSQEIDVKTENDDNENSSSHSALVQEFMKKFSQPQKPIQETFIDKPAKKPAPIFSLNNNSKYVKPPIDLLMDYEKEDDGETQEEIVFKAELLEETLKNFNVPARVLNITKGPSVTRYEIQMPPGKSVKLIQGISNDIAMALEANGGVRIEAPIPGRNAVGIEVPNKKRDTIGVKEIITSKEFETAKGLTFILGKDIAGTDMFCDITDMPHLLVAGSTGSGKSVCLNVLIVSLLYRFSPEDLKIILIDPKRVEFSAYAGIPHLIMPEPITEVKDAINSLKWLTAEMDRRYDLFRVARVNNISGYNSCEAVVSGKEPKLPVIVLIIDELSDLMMQGKRDVEDCIKRLTALARASGIHIVVATQRPSVDVITGTIKANLPSRIAFAVSSSADSKTILDGGGAENLLGKGDMLYAPKDLNEPKRIQCAFISSKEINAIVEYIKENNPSYYDENIAKEICKKDEEEQKPVKPAEGDEFKMISDPLFPKAVKLVIETKQASVSMIQRRFAVGFSRAARILDQMEVANFVSPQDDNHSKPRTVYITMEEFKEIFPDEA